MAKRIEHKIENGKELKWCAGCKSYKGLDQFHTTGGRTWDNLYYYCRDCYNENRDNSPRKNAARSWRQLNDRVNKDERYASKGIEVRIDKETYIEWYCKHWFKGCRVDRIDNEGHYEAGNLQLVSLLEHNEKLRTDRLNRLGVTEPDGQRYCYSCKNTKPVTEFYRKARKVSKSNPLGLEENCKQCERQQRMKRYYRRKPNA